MSIPSAVAPNAFNCVVSNASSKNKSTSNTPDNPCCTDTAAFDNLSGVNPTPFNNDSPVPDIKPVTPSAKSPNCDGKFANMGKLLVVNPASEPPTVFNILLPNALATCDVIISATKPNNDDEPLDIN